MPNDPLYVIDGVVRNKAAFDALDPNEVDEVSVLKDAGSAAIYGVRSTNGVIMRYNQKRQLAKSSDHLQRFHQLGETYKDQQADGCK